MELGKYLEEDGAEKVAIIAVNWLEDLYGGASPDRMDRMIAVIPPAAYVIRGDAATSRDFGGIANVPALFIFDGKGRLVHRDGGTPGYAGKARIDRGQISRIVDSLR